MASNATTNKTPWVKIIIIGVVVIVAGVFIWAMFKKPAEGTWKEVKGGDISGDQYDIAVEAYTDLTAAKKRAIELGAKSFLVNGNRVFYKNTATGQTVTPNATWTLYILE